MSADVPDPRELGRVLRERLQAVFGPRLKDVVLYGSRARGDASDDSDYDFLVLLDRVEDFGRDLELIGSVAGALSLAHDIVVSALPIAQRAFETRETPLLCNVRREGISVP